MQTRAQQTRLRILEAITRVVEERGFHELQIRDIAREAGVSVGIVCRYFPSKEAMLLAIFEHNVLRFESWAPSMPPGTMVDRLRAALNARLATLQDHRPVVTSVTALSLDPTFRGSALGPMADATRSRNAAVYALAVMGATDAPPPDVAPRVVSLFYGLHLLTVLLWTQDRSPGQRMTHETLDVVCRALKLGRPFMTLVGRSALAKRAEALVGDLLRPSMLASPPEQARRVLTRIFARRRVFKGVNAAPSDAAYLLHLPRIQAFMNAGEPIHLVLPAFPAKAPNPTKVLGPLPDSAEYLALQSLTTLLDAITEAYKPGARLTICSDGGVFADAVKVSDADVARYRRELQRMVDEMDESRIRIFGLEDAFGALKPRDARAQLMEKYARSEESLREGAESSASLAAQVDGIHRFMFEDEVVRSPSVSRTQVRKQTRAVAYDVVRRSEAWGALVSSAFPDALRLSIHPQPDVSEKIGIHLLPTEDEWLTPWHGVAVIEGKRCRLMKRSDAEKLGAVVVEEDGRAMHMELTG